MHPLSANMRYTRQKKKTFAFNINCVLSLSYRLSSPKDIKSGKRIQIVHQSEQNPLQKAEKKSTSQSISIIGAQWANKYVYIHH